MDNTQIISKVRSLLLTGDSVSDDAITFYIDLVKKIIKAKCKATEYPTEMDEVLIDVVMAFINRRGKEGFSNIAEGEVSVSVNSMINSLLADYDVVFEDYISRNTVSNKVRFI